MLSADATWRKMDTRHEGKILYEKHWNFWVRAGIKGDSRSYLFFPGYENNDQNTDKLFQDIGVASSPPKSESEIWDRIGTLWNWWVGNVKYDVAAYGTLFSQPNSWPSIQDYAKYYATHGGLVYAACFSTAHLFASLLGRIVPSRRRYALAEAHHTEAGALPTATHVYVAVYVSDRWFYLDPSAISIATFPSFAAKQSVGVASWPSVDYEHPYNTIRLPLSDFECVPFLSA